MNKPTIFKDDSGLFQVRVINRDGEPWFVGVDVCEVLEIANSRDALSRIDKDERDAVDLSDAIGRTQITTVINEPGLYSLVLSSRKPEAKSFKRWITHDVIPQIRKTGSYSVQYPIPQTYSEALRLAADLAEQNQKMLPKAESFDRFISAENLQSMNVVAKTLGWGRNKLFRELRERRILLANNTPYQEYIERGYFEVKQRAIRMGDSEVDKPQTYVTAKGIEYLSKTLNKGA